MNKFLLILLTLSTISFNVHSQIIDEDLTPDEFLAPSSNYLCHDQFITREIDTKCGMKKVSYNICSPFALALAYEENHTTERATGSIILNRSNNRKIKLVSEVMDNYLNYIIKRAGCSQFIPILAQSGLNLAQLIAVNSYTGGNYHQLNFVLRPKRDLHGNLLPQNEANRLKGKLKLQPYLDIMIDGLKKLPKYVGKTYRILNLPKNLHKQYKIGNTVTLEGFTSTSLDIGFTLHGGNNRDNLVINSLSGRDITTISQHKKEREVLFLPNTKFRITRIEYVERPQNYQSGVDNDIRRYYFLDEILGEE